MEDSGTCKLSTKHAILKRLHIRSVLIILRVQLTVPAGFCAGAMMGVASPVA